MALDFFAGCVGGVAGVLVGHPLDTVKVRLQVQDPKNPVYRGTWHTFSEILKNESVRGLYSGVNSPLVGIALVNAIVFGVYGNALKVFLNYHHSNVGESNTWAQIHQVGKAGSTAGLAQVLVVTPLELAKSRLQVDKGVNYKSISDCLLKTFKKGGIRGLYRGVFITTAREVPSFYLYFVTYEGLMMNLPGRTVDMMLSGGMAGVNSWLSVYPVDVIKTRMQIDGIGDKPKYRNSWHCFKTGLSEEGHRFLFRGLTSTMLRAFPVNAVTFAVVTWILKLRTHDPNLRKLKKKSDHGDRSSRPP